MSRWVVLLVALPAGACLAEDPALLGSPDDPVGPSVPTADLPEVRTDRSVQPEVLPIDILWVVDNSPEMDGPQASLAYNFLTFVEGIDSPRFDWHIGVITTDMLDPAHQGRLREAQGHRWIDPGTADASNVFAQMVDVGTSGIWKESGFDAIVAALTRRDEDHNLGFRREGAALEVVVVSDDDDQSNIDISDFIDWYVGFQPGPGLHGFSSIVAPMEGCDWRPGIPGLAYIAVTRVLGGVEGDICRRDWSSTVDLIGEAVGSRLREVVLSETPVEGTLRVSLETPYDVRDLLVREYRYDPVRNSVVLVALPSPGDAVEVSYEVADVP